MCCVFCFLIIITDTIDHAVDHEYDARPSSCRPSKSDQKIGITITSRYIIDSVFFLCVIYLNSTINSTTFLFQGYSILGIHISAKLTIQIAVESLTSDIELLSTVYL